jgi:hypothetical protein
MVAAPYRARQDRRVDDESLHHNPLVVSDFYQQFLFSFSLFHRSEKTACD